MPFSCMEINFNKKIKRLTIDPNGFCNAKCWYCPLRYEKINHQNIMSINNFKKIINDIIDLKGDIIDENLNHIYTNQNNEIILYPHFEEMLIFLKKIGWKTTILSNGKELTPKIFKLLQKYKDSIYRINLNIPALDKELWMKQTDSTEEEYKKLINNLDYIYDNLIDIDKFNIRISGAIETSFLIRGGHLSKMENYPDYLTNITIEEQRKKFLEKYPKWGSVFYNNPCIYDWKGLMEQNKIYSSTISNLMINKKEKDKIVDCWNGGKLFEWMHINPNGDLYICNDDYNYNTKFGNVFKQNIKDIWLSDIHKNIIKKETTQGMCLNCTYATWEDQNLK